MPRYAQKDRRLSILPDSSINKAMAADYAQSTPKAEKNLVQAQRYRDALQRRKSRSLASSYSYILHEARPTRPKDESDDDVVSPRDSISQIGDIPDPAKLSRLVSAAGPRRVAVQAPPSRHRTGGEKKDMPAPRRKKGKVATSPQ